MRKVRLTAIMAMVLISLSSMSCKDTKKENNKDNHLHSEINQGKMDISNSAMNSNTQNSVEQKALTNYIALKDALANDDNANAKEFGIILAQSLKSFDSSGFSSNEKLELNDIIENATEQAEHIGYSDIAHQREHFKILSKDIIDMVAITGTKMKVYEHYCPMYDNKNGGAWLSMNEEIRNPYFGNKMLKCGEVKREIN